MIFKRDKAKQAHSSIFYTVVTVMLLCTVFLIMINYIYKNAEAQGFEQLHLHTSQIKEDMHLQIISDRENLTTMASFAANLYERGESYDLLFDSFEPIGLIQNVGILKPDGTIVTSFGSLNLGSKISFDEEAAKGEYTSGRVEDLTKSGREIIRSSVPIVSN
ncbi:MAG: hypothetical protein IJ454_00925, partial [Clostridia bacterium]|nr:hypothetical protein [Clostridia bacterium]